MLLNHKGLGLGYLKQFPLLIRFNCLRLLLNNKFSIIFKPASRERVVSNDIRLVELLETNPEEPHARNAVSQFPTTGIQSLQ